MISSLLFSTSLVDKLCSIVSGGGSELLVVQTVLAFIESLAAAAICLFHVNGSQWMAGRSVEKRKRKRSSKRKKERERKQERDRERK